MIGSYEESDGDPSILEENTLSACLVKILQKSDSEEHNHLNPLDHTTVGISLASDDYEGTDELICPSVTGTKPKPRTCPSSLQIGDASSESEIEKLRKWREAGVALRKALSEQSSDSSCQNTLEHV